MSNESWTPDFGSIDQSAPNWAAKRPRRIALLGDFSGGALRGRIETGAALAKRRPLRVEFDTLDDALQRLELAIPLPIGADGAHVEVPVDELEAFHPDTLYANVPLFAALNALRKRINNPATFQAAASEIQSWGGDAGELASRIARRSAARGASPSASSRLSDFARLTGRDPDDAPEASSVETLVRAIVGPLVVQADSPDKAKLLEVVDGALSEAMRSVLHQPDFQNMEALWRGVDFLLRKLETGPQLEVHLIDISATELAADLSSVQDLGDSGLYELLVSKPAENVDGGYTWIAGCYQFEATPPHAELLGRMARVASHAGAAFITGIDADVFCNRREPPHRLISGAFASLREMPEAGWLGLLAPRFMLRYPYGKRSDPISSFSFEEFTLEGGLRGMLWGHPALLALSVLAVPGGQLTIGDIPFHSFTDPAGDRIALPCTDRMINVNVAALLREVGITAVMAHKGEGAVHLAGLEAINGEGLAVAGGGKPPSAGNRVDIHAGVASNKTTGGWSASVRSNAAPAAASGVAAAAAAAGAAAESTSALAPADEAGDDSAAAADTDHAAAEATDGGVDDELAALLASLDDTPAPAAASGADSADGAAAETAEEPAADDGMDPELAALLASLN